MNYSQCIMKLHPLWRIRVGLKLGLRKAEQLKGLSHWACLLIVPVAPRSVGLVWHSILSNPGASVFILCHHKRAWCIIQNRTQVNTLWFLLLIWCYYATLGFTVCVSHEVCKHTADCEPFIFYPDCIHCTQLHCTLARIQSKSSPLSSLTCVLIN